MPYIVSATHPDDLFQDAWLKIKEKELRGQDFNHVKDFRRYFYLVLRNLSNDGHRIETINISLTGREQIKDENKTELEPCEQDLIEWMYDEPKDDDELFYKNVVILQTKVPTHKAVQQQSIMSKATYLKVRKIANEKLKNDITIRINNDSNRTNNYLV